MKKLLSNSLKCVVILIALIFFLGGVAQAHLYGVTEDNGYSELYIIDPQTGKAENIGFIREETSSDGVLLYRQVTGIAFNPITGVLYATGVQIGDTEETLSLITIDPCTGIVTSQEDISGDIDWDDQPGVDIRVRLW